MAQVQCPNEGGYKVTTKIVTIDRRTGKELKKPREWVGEILLLGSLLFLLSGTFLLFPNRGLSSDPAIVFLVIGLSCAVLLILWWRVPVDKYNKIDKITKYKHECLLCGYRWERREDEPPPEAHVRPDLIAMGEQRLAEERRRQEELEAAHFLEQQRRRK